MADSTPPESLSQQELDHIRQLVRVVADNRLAELSIGQPDGITVSVRTVSEIAATQVVALQPTESAPAAAAPAHPAPAAGPSVRHPGAVAIESPMVGTFYRAQTPSDPPFVKEGDVITIGQPIGLIEAMKVYSEIPAEIAGRVVEFMAGNGQLVQLGQPLLYIEPA
ncbi:MAG: acetyl-CoA carboxylase biotin carboxyl carrier protein subunit [Capsulimonadaceae bacterium]|nr:acetyl-CoA carboxylase biotin carboxyl carrier protein subunit [Capsulimonadaceae bacterium]